MGGNGVDSLLEHDLARIDSAAAVLTAMQRRLLDLLRARTAR
jgi:hypothetical protein